MLLHNLFIDLKEPLEEPIRLRKYIKPAHADEEGAVMDDARTLRDRLAMFVQDYWQLNADHRAIRK